VWVCEKSVPGSWEQVWSKKMEEGGVTGLQVETGEVEAQVGRAVRFVKLRIEEGWEDFVAVYEIKVEGAAS